MQRQTQKFFFKEDEKELYRGLHSNWGHKNRCPFSPEIIIS